MTTEQLAGELKKKTKNPVPEIGIHKDVPMHIYHRWNALSSSALVTLARSPKHLIAYWRSQYKDTPALILGRAIHSAILEPALFEKQYAVGPAGDRRTKAVKDAWLILEQEHGQGMVLKPDDYARVLDIRDAVLSKTYAKVLFGDAGDFELSVVWRDETTGLLCKARADRVSWKIAGMEGGTIVDVKSTADARIDAFERAIVSYNYHQRAAFYLRGFQAVGLDVRNFAFIAVEKDPPYESRPYDLVAAAIERGEQGIDDLLKLYARCKETNEWPGYEDKFEPIGLPAWAW